MVFAEELTLFDFEFVQNQPSEEEINEAFALLVQRMKEQGNYYSFNRVEIKDIKKYFDYFIERGWIVKGRVRADLLDYHTVDEVYDRISEYVDELLQRPHETIVYTDDTWRYWNRFIPCRFHAVEEESQKRRRELYSRLREIQKKVAITLGLKHFLECPKSRGSVSDSFASKGYKKHLIPFLIQKVTEINDFDEMKSFFNSYFFVGRRDEIWSDSSGFKIPPYPEYNMILVDDLSIAALTEATEKNAKEVLKLVLKHAGKGHSSEKSIQERGQNIIYTPTYSKEDYINSLTGDDIKLIIEDTERLNRLHGRAV